jgi:hypothetical protein
MFGIIVTFFFSKYFFKNFFCLKDIKSMHLKFYGFYMLMLKIKKKIISIHFQLKNILHHIIKHTFNLNVCLISKSILLIKIEKLHVSF